MTHVVVTGASSGIGESIARAWLGRGASVTLVARRRALLDKIAESAPDATRVVTADLGDPACAESLLADCRSGFGPIDVLVNNAGVQIVEAAETTSWERAEALLRLDLHTPLRLIQLVLPEMLERRSGSIVNVASMAAIGPTPGMMFYNAAKGGLSAASEALRGEVRSRGLNVVTVYPGPVKSAMEAAGRAAYQDSAAVRNTPVGDPDELARMIIRAVERRRARVIYPRVYGLARHFPNVTRWFLDSFTPPLRADRTLSS
jgi:short-subunit dehydrogenase